MAVGVVTLLVVFVLPKFEIFFKSFKKELPLPTRMLLNSATFLGEWYWVLLLATAAAVVAAVFALRNERFRGHFDRWLLQVPVVGPTIRFAMVERFARVLGSMLQAGVTLPDAMDVAARGTNNRFVRKTLNEAREAMMRGEGIAAPLAASGMFPRPASQMIRVGESTGYLDTQLESIATFYERELDYKIKKITSLFEPAVLIVMGGIVGFVALALVSAMYGIYRT
jgi:type IV pilus assembly protein PilC